jgi:hypothetical protein
MFGLTTLEKWFTTAAKDIVKGSKATAAAIQKIDNPTSQALVEGISATAFPQAVPIEEAAFKVLGKALTAVKAAGAAAAQNGTSLQLDAATSADLQALVPTIEGFAKNQGAVQPAK